MAPDLLAECPVTSELNSIFHEETISDFDGLSPFAFGNMGWVPELVLQHVHVASASIAGWTRSTLSNKDRSRSIAVSRRPPSLADPFLKGGYTAWPFSFSGSKRRGPSVPLRVLFLWTSSTCPKQTPAKRLLVPRFHGETCFYLHQLELTQVLVCRCQFRCLQCRCCCFDYLLWERGEDALRSDHAGQLADFFPSRFLNCQRALGPVALVEFFDEFERVRSHFERLLSTDLFLPRSRSWSLWLSPKRTGLARHVMGPDCQFARGVWNRRTLVWSGSSIFPRHLVPGLYWEDSVVGPDLPPYGCFPKSSLVLMPCRKSLNDSGCTPLRPSLLCACVHRVTVAGRRRCNMPPAERPSPAAQKWAPRAVAH